jgi:beta-N-acetylhexosaminidase
MSLDTLSLAQKAGQLFFIGIPGPELDGLALELLDEVSPGGVCLFARNIREAAQTRELLDGLRAHLPATPFLSVDQEGGLVDRLRRIMTPMPAANKLRNAGDAARLGAIIGETLRILGFNMDFAPVVDVIDGARAKLSNGLFSRTFGKGKDDVAALAAAFLSQLQQNGIVGCLKHFPGLGASEVDSHEELPGVDVSETELNDVDLFPYHELLTGSRVEAVMTAHAAFPNSRLQEKGQNGKLLPSSLSSNFVTKLLRGELGFDGLVITDDLEMGAIVNNYGIGEACKMAVSAGVDMLAICADPDAIREGYRAVLSAVERGEITDQRLQGSLDRIARLKKGLLPPAIFDSARLAELSDEIAEFNAELGS